MCLRAQVIDDDNGGVRRVRRSYGLSDNNRGVVIGREIDDAFKGLETTVEASSI